MKLIYYSIKLNHHQVYVADELFALLGSDFVFVELKNINENKGCLEDYRSRPYLLCSWVSETSFKKAMNLALNADVCIFGGTESLPFMKSRMERDLLSFYMSERWLKRGIYNIISPNLLKVYIDYWYRGWNQKPMYSLCCSAFAKNDFKRLKIFGGKCFKWGYFSKANKHNCETSEFREKINRTNIMWCGRFLSWKHPELVILLAVRLKKNGYNVNINMYGDGPCLDVVKKLISQENVSDMVTLNGSFSNDKIIAAMRHHDIFLFTSDKNEGWGVVANEAMSNNCCIVASDEIGSIPYLVKPGRNGMVFRSNSISSLYEQVKFLLDNPIERKRIANRGRETMVKFWNPANAAKSLLTLIEDIKAGRESSIAEGPGSKA